MLHTTETELVGLGLYSFSEAARLTGVPSRSIRRWTLGYSYRREGISHPIPAIWGATPQSAVRFVGVTFFDLIETRFVQAFRSEGVSWKNIRTAAQRLRDMWDVSHPFATQRFSTDGRTIFLETMEREGETKLLDVVKSQYAFREFLAPLLRGVDFAEDRAARWYPQFPSRRIVIDPTRSFGRPIVDAWGVSTEILSRAARVEGSIRSAARWYDVPPDAVKAAVEFEESLAA